MRLCLCILPKLQYTFLKIGEQIFTFYSAAKRNDKSIKKKKKVKFLGKATSAFG